MIEGAALKARSRLKVEVKSLPSVENILIKTFVDV